MSAQIFSAPEEVQVPNYDFSNANGWQAQDEKFILELSQWIKEKGYSGESAGETIQFPVADGYAIYMVASLKPLMLVHAPIGDAWHFAQAHLLTTKEVKSMIERAKKLKDLFKS